MTADADFLHHLLRSAELLRRGHFEAARHAVETALRAAPRAPGASAALVAAVARRDEAALRVALDDALVGVESGAAPFRLADPSSEPAPYAAPRGAPGRRATERPWVAREPAREVLGRVVLRRQVAIGFPHLDQALDEAALDAPVTEPPAPSREPRPVSSALSQWALDVAGPMQRGPDGQLVVRRDGPVILRRRGCLALRGALDPAPVPRLVRGRDTGEVLGGEADPFVRAPGPVFGVWAAGAGAEFETLSLDDDLLYVREPVLWAFDESLAYDNAHLEVGRVPLDVVQLRGVGAVALRLDGRAPIACPLEEGDEMAVDPDALLGWVGRLFPRAAPDAGRAMLGFQGEGTLLLLTS